jgi:tyrosinase
MRSYTDFAAFSNTRWDQSGNAGTYGSLENIHDNIHGRVGGNGGNMSDLDYSAFDPAFWLHHCTFEPPIVQLMLIVPGNIDRLFAMWQAINPKSYVVPEQTVNGTYTQEVGSTEDVETQLKPFHQGVDGDFWTSAKIVKTETVADKKLNSYRYFPT